MPASHGRHKYKRRVTAYVLPGLPSDQDMILGNDWLKWERVDLSYQTNTCVLHRAGVVMHPTKITKAELNNRVETITEQEATLLVMNGARCFVVSEVDANNPLARLRLHEPNGLAEAEDYPPSEPLTEADIDPHVSSEIRSLLMEYKDVFATPHGLPPDRGIEHVIQEIPGSSPVYRPPYRLSPDETKETCAQVRQLISDGFIEPSNSPYGAPSYLSQKRMES